ncbi:MAG: phosphatase PAP2 family protein [Armatimonadetes bacterium]|nr:phosphatase PAP2 family protein [Armatimonadota bacterium]
MGITSRAVLSLVTTLCAAAALAQPLVDAEPVAASTLDPSTIAATDRWFAQYMTHAKPLGETGADLGNFIGGTWGHVLICAAVWQGREHISPDFNRQAGRALLTNAVLTGSIKRLVGRRRPDNSTDTSWPSGHTSSTVAALTVLEAHLGHGALKRLPLMAVGATVALSRIQHNRHWLSDTLAGAALGYACGRAACGKISDETLALTGGMVLALGALVQDAEAHPNRKSQSGPRLLFSGSPSPAKSLTLWHTDF